ncbi:MAG: polyhydroxyalkanoate synthesis repressor PhaR [Gammaproteobacteria bacterium]|nr:polyhydroxyalkanoate synthesis repressor PhaR [Gammaproteobacteria bacterium]
MSETRIIKKYPNRRLYDTAISSYITLNDVRKLVTEGVSFQVVDVRSKEDITRSILLQIITEQEESGEPIFTSDALTKIIRAYGKNIENVMGDFLERSLEVFTEQQQAMTKQMQSLIGGDPVSMMTDITKRNFEMWSNMQQELLKGVQPPKPDDKDD